MIALETVHIEIFTPLEGREFTARVGEYEVSLKLHAVSKLGHKRADAARDPFSLIFRGAQGLRFPQGTYLMTCDSLGEMELFITQVADGALGSEFEAIFT